MTHSASSISKQDYLIDSVRYPSEGCWAFCRFDHAELPALRLGFQRGGFNGGFVERNPSAEYLQLHLELMTRDGAILWLPSGTYPANSVACDPHENRIRLDHNGRNIMLFQGWPNVECHLCSEDGDLQADLSFVLNAVTTLPDCLLPYCLFAMWESMGDVSGSVRYRDRSAAVRGKVFFDHTRVIPRRHLLIPRHMYVYTTLYFADGSGFFGYHSVDAHAHPVDNYCFGVYLDAFGQGRFMEGATLTHLVLDRDGIANSWKISAQTTGLTLTIAVTVHETRIIKSWGSPHAPQTRREFSIIPLVLSGSVEIGGDAQPRTLDAYGLAEYFNADLWPADQAATPDGGSPPATKAGSSR